MSEYRSQKSDVRSQRTEVRGRKLEFGRRTRRRPIGRDYGAARMGQSEERNLNSENINQLDTLFIIDPPEANLKYSIFNRQYSIILSQ
jgi:hypothetical protein